MNKEVQHDFFQAQRFLHAGGEHTFCWGLIRLGMHQKDQQGYSQKKVTHAGGRQLAFTRDK
jgi:hypothetical protein